MGSGFADAADSGFVPAFGERQEAFMETATQSVKLGDVEVTVVRVGTGSPLMICGGPQLGHPYMRLGLPRQCARAPLLRRPRQRDDAARGFLGINVRPRRCRSRKPARWSWPRALQHPRSLAGWSSAYLYASAHPKQVTRWSWSMSAAVRRRPGSGAWEHHDVEPCATR